MDRPELSDRPRLRYGIRAYGKWSCFAKKAEYKEYLEDWMASTEGAERDRAVDALVALRGGQRFTNTDL